MMELRQEKEVLLLNHTLPKPTQTADVSLANAMARRVGGCRPPFKRLRNEKQNEKLVKIIYETAYYYPFSQFTPRTIWLLRLINERRKWKEKSSHCASLTHNQY